MGSKERLTALGVLRDLRDLLKLLVNTPIARLTIDSAGRLRILIDASGTATPVTQSGTWNVVPVSHTYPTAPSDYTTTDSWANAFSAVDKGSTQAYMSGEIDIHLLNVHASNSLDYRVEVSKDNTNWVLATPIQGSDPVSGSIAAGASRHVIVHGAGGRYYRVQAKSTTAGAAATLRTRHSYWI